MTEPYEAEYESIDISELDALPSWMHTAPGERQHNTSSEQSALNDVQNAAMHGERISFNAHDDASGLLVHVYDNPGHGAGISASELLERMNESGNSLSQQLSEDSPIGELTDIDFFQVNIYR